MDQTSIYFIVKNDHERHVKKIGRARCATAGNRIGHQAGRQVPMIFNRA
jgi:hypothetical protein